jgi:hypothetical protein
MFAEIYEYFFGKEEVNMPLMKIAQPAFQAEPMHVCIHDQLVARMNDKKVDARDTAANDQQNELVADDASSNTAE